MAESGGGGGGRGADGNTYKRFSLSDSKQSSLSFLLPSEDNEELITEIKQPSLSSVNLTDSVCSSNSFSSNNNFFRFSEAEFNENNDIHNKVDEIDVKTPITVADDTTCNNSEPEDMQDFITIYDNFNKSELVKSIADHEDNINEKTIEPLFDYHKTYRPATSSPLFRNRKMSLSLQDVSTIDIFPLESKTMNAFSTETIQTQSMSSTTKSKDSGFQHSASCLSLNSGNRSYEHIQSKVKQYIKDIKTSEAQRKKQKREQNIHLEIPKSKNSSILNLNSSENINKFEPKELLDTIKSLRTELKEKDTVLNELQLNYNALLEKYAEAVNQIDLMRLRSSLNYSSYRSDCYSDINSDVIDNQQNYSSLNNNTSVWSNKFLLPNSHSSNHNIINKNSNLNEESPITSRQNIANKSNKDDLFFTPISNSNSINISNCDKDDELLQISEFSRKTFAHSTPVNSIKSVTLRPISRMYSSSSRLDKKVSPLPSSSSSSNKCLTKKKNTIINKENVESLNKNCDKDDNKSGTLIAGDDDNDDDVFYRKSYLNCRSISQLELPRDDPFEKVQKWQASLPTMSLIDTQSNSSFGSLDNIDLKPHSYSLDRNLNHDFYDNSNRKQKETKSFNRKYNFKFNSTYQISQSDQNLTMINNPRIYDNDNNLTSNKKNSRRSYKNILKRTNAVDDINDILDNELKFSSTSNVKKRLFTEPLTSCKKEEKNLTNLDDSSSMSSSILSSPKHKEIVTTGKDKNKQPKVNEKLTKKIIEKLSSSTFLKDTRNKIQNKNKSLSLDYEKNSNENNLRKRVCFTPVNRNKISSNEKPVQKYAWESPKHVVNSSQKSDSMINKSSITTSQPNNNNKPNVVRHRTETLKSFTEILNCDINSSSNYNKLKDSTVGSDKDSSDNKNSEEIVTDKSLMASDNYNKDLEDVEQRVKYVRKEVDRILKSLNNMKCTGAVNTN